ncbi:hypothetical protein ONZ45_g16801 [Pleurotus djamor]|nr:hypothetical protein ONZ45_g16801 [Pleurotus djamor]
MSDDKMTPADFAAEFMRRGKFNRFEMLQAERDGLKLRLDSSLPASSMKRRIDDCREHLSFLLDVVRLIPPDDLRATFPGFTREIARLELAVDAMENRYRISLRESGDGGGIGGGGVGGSLSGGDGVRVDEDTGGAGPAPLEEEPLFLPSPSTHESSTSHRDHHHHPSIQPVDNPSVEPVDNPSVQPIQNPSVQPIDNTLMDDEDEGSGIDLPRASSPFPHSPILHRPESLPPIANPQLPPSDEPLDRQESTDDDYQSLLGDGSDFDTSDSEVLRRIKKRNGSEDFWRPKSPREVGPPHPGDDGWVCRHRGTCGWKLSKGENERRRAADQLFVGNDRCERCRNNKKEVDCIGTGCYICRRCGGLKKTCSHARSGKGKPSPKRKGSSKGKTSPKSKTSSKGTSTTTTPRKRKRHSTTPSSDANVEDWVPDAPSEGELGPERTPERQGPNRHARPQAGAYDPPPLLPRFPSVEYHPHRARENMEAGLSPVDPLLLMSADQLRDVVRTLTEQVQMLSGQLNRGEGSSGGNQMSNRGEGSSQANQREDRGEGSSRGTRARAHPQVYVDVPPAPYAIPPPAPYAIPPRVERSSTADEREIGDHLEFGEMDETDETDD